MTEPEHYTGRVIGGAEFKLIQQRKQSDWECQLFGGVHSGMLWRPYEGEVPNWFWRRMQFLIVGNRWRRANR